MAELHNLRAALDDAAETLAYASRLADKAAGSGGDISPAFDALADQLLAARSLVRSLVTDAIQAAFDAEEEAERGPTRPGGYRDDRPPEEAH